MHRWVLKCIILILVASTAYPADTYQQVPDTYRRYETTNFVLIAENDYYLTQTEQIIASTRQHLINLLDDSLSYKPSVYLVSDLETFHQILSGKIPDWGAAAAIARKQMIVLKSPAHFNLGKSLKELLAHEYAHLAVAHKCGIREAPRWIHEGVAMYISMEWGWSNNLAMGQASVFGQFIPLADIELMNRFNQGKANVAYAESYLAVSKLLDWYGKDAVAILLKAIAEGKDYSEALYIATGSHEKEFEKDFKDYLQNRYNIASLFMDTIFFWLFLAFVLIVGAFLKFRKRRHYYKKWEEEEQLQSTDFDYGDPDNPEQTDDDEPWRN